MIVLLQRVTHAHVSVGPECVGAIERGLLALVAVEAGDTPRVGERMLERVLGYRVFPDDAGRMNRSVQDTGGGLLLVPQFTLAADTSKGMRPSFSSAGTPEESRALFDAFVAMARARHAGVATGVFGADMQVTLTNDGPVTFLLRVPPPDLPPATRRA
jgi:D-tyrosyl-tRNA(Tyr) deacylase